MLRDFGFDFGKALLLAFYHSCTRIKFLRRDRLPKEGGYICASNHVSYYDPFAVGIGLPVHINYMAKRELFDEPFAFFIKMMKAYPVDRDKMSRKTLKYSIDLLKNGSVVGIFPEGTRSEDGEIHEGQRGAATISMMADVPVVPAALIGSQNALIRKFPPKWKQIIVLYGDPIYPNEFEGTKRERIEKFTVRIIEEIKNLKKELEETWEP